LSAVSTPSASAKPTSDDALLVERVARGDSAALRTLYERHAARAMAVALRVLGARTESEEIVQETFVEIWKRAREFDVTRGSAASWISTIARSRAIDRVRARGASARTLSAIAVEPPPAAAASPLEDVEQRLQRERISSALGELPVEQRRTIELAYFEGFSYREIAERTGEALGTVKTRARLGMEKLAILLGEGGR
jgi:RNA polymerase sigma-70 factor (ECF subfamily)